MSSPNPPPPIAECRRCGCTDLDCRQCIKKTGTPCYWIQPDLCSACATHAEIAQRGFHKDP